MHSLDVMYLLRYPSSVLELAQYLSLLVRLSRGPFFLEKCYFLL